MARLEMRVIQLEIKLAEFHRKIDGMREELENQKTKLNELQKKVEVESIHHTTPIDKDRFMQSRFTKAR